MNKILVLIMTFLLVCLTGFFSPGNLNAAAEEEVREEALPEEELIPEEGYEPYDREVQGEQSPEENIPEEEPGSGEEQPGSGEEQPGSAEEEQYVPDPGEGRL